MSYVLLSVLALKKDQHNHLLRQFFHIKQHTTISEYIEHFDELVHQIRAHDPSLALLLLLVDLLMALESISKLLL